MNIYKINDVREVIEGNSYVGRGIIIGKTFGTRLSNKATVFGGIILIAIGVEIFLTGILG